MAIDPSIIILLAGVAIMFIGGAIDRALDRKDKNKDAAWFLRQVNKNGGEDWDDEWLHAESKRHTVTKIEPAKLYWFGDITKPVSDGFRWTCNCSGKGVGINLKMANMNFEKHVKEEREKALAAIGRFK